MELALWARPGVAQDDLNTFYQRAATLAALSGQGHRLASAIEALEASLADLREPDLQAEVGDLLSRVRRAGTVLQQHPGSTSEVADLQSRSNIEETGSDVVAAAIDVQSVNRGRDIAVETRALETRIEGLSTLLNVHYGSLKKLEIERARYGGLVVPLVLENQIQEVSGDVRRVEESLREVRRRLAAGA